eukprot:1143354-Pelagomonas_calceolata.AAC.6
MAMKFTSKLNGTLVLHPSCLSWFLVCSVKHGPPTPKRMALYLHKIWFRFSTHAAGGRRRGRSGFGMVGCNQYSIRTAGGESKYLRESTRKAARGCNYKRGIWDLKVACQLIITSCVNQASPRAFAEGPSLRLVPGGIAGFLINACTRQQVKIDLIGSSFFSGVRVADKMVEDEINAAGLLVPGCEAALTKVRPPSLPLAQGFP